MLARGGSSGACCLRGRRCRDGGLALSPCHALPIAWLANREALVSLTFGALALTSYLRFREDGGLRHAAAATLSLRRGAGGGRVRAVPRRYVLAFELLARGESLARRALGLLTYGVPAAGYLAARAMLGYGTHGSSFYDDPLHEPLAFLQTAPRRFCALVTQEWMTVDGDDATSPWVFAGARGGRAGHGGRAHPARLPRARAEGPSSRVACCCWGRSWRWCRCSPSIPRRACSASRCSGWRQSSR